MQSAGRECLRKVLAFLARHLLAFLARLRQSDRDGLLAALHLAAFAAAAALRGAALVTLHFAFDVPAGAPAVASLPFLLCHEFTLAFMSRPWPWRTVPPAPMASAPDH